MFVIAVLIQGVWEAVMAAEVNVIVAFGLISIFPVAVTMPQPFAAAMVLVTV